VVNTPAWSETGPDDFSIEYLVEVIDEDDVRTQSRVDDNVGTMANDGVQMQALVDDEVEPIASKNGKLMNTKRSVLKEAVNSGQQYINTSGNFVAEKIVKSPCSAICAHKCCQVFDKDARDNIFIAFYRLEKTRQWDFVARHTDVLKKKSTKVAGSPRRKVTHNYYLTLTDSKSVQRLRVCQKFFLHTLSISYQTVKTALSKVRPGAGVSPDKRGTTKRPASPDTQERRENIRKHIKSFPVMPSHYCRKTSKKLYLDKNLSVSKMHRLFQEEKGSATLRQYREIFKSDFNYSFFSPRKDICNICFAYDNSSKEDRDAKKQRTYEIHIENKAKGRKFKDADKTEALLNPRFVTACFDFQKVLDTPKADVSLFYYKRKLNVYNLTIYTMATKTGDCYVWDEVTAKKGSTEVSSCLLAFMSEQIAAGATDFSFYSDNCAGQNKNRFVFAMYAFVSKLHNVTISHRFLEQGHTQMEVDSVHALIESTQKKNDIFEPKQWFALMRAAKKSGQAYRVHEMDTSSFFDFKQFVAATNWSKNCNGNSVNWLKVKAVKVERESPNILHYQYEHGSEFSRVFLYDDANQIKPVSRTRKRKSNNFVFDPVLKLAYDRPIKISSAKYKDLLSLCNSNVIPKIYHSFYQSLPHVGDDQPFQDDEDDDNFLDEFFVNEF
jgi:hypothetical protein